MSQKLVKGPDGEYVWMDASAVAPPPQRAVDMPVRGEALGCIASQVEEMRADAKLAGLNIEWKEDPHVPGFYDAESPNQREWDRAAKHYGLVNKHRGSGQGITADELEAARARVIEQHGPAKERV